MIYNIFEFVRSIFFDIGLYDYLYTLSPTQTLAEINPVDFVFGISVLVGGSWLIVFILKFFFALIRKFIEVIKYD